MEGKEFLTVAQKLVQIRSEAAIRSAASRTYYAIFNTGIKLLTDLGFSFPKDASAINSKPAFKNTNEKSNCIHKKITAKEVKALAQW